MPTPQPLMPFGEWIAQQAAGKTEDEATAALSEVVERVGRLAKKGKVTIEIDVVPADDDAQNVTVACTVTAKPPKPSAPRSIYFVGDGGSLHREDPYQGRLDVGPAREVDVDAPVRNLDQED